MKIVRFIFSSLILLMFFSAFTVYAAESEKPKYIIVGYSVEGNPDVDSRDAEAALRVWAKELGDQFGFKVEATLYDSVEKLVADFLSHKLDFVSMSSINYLRFAHTLKVKPEMAQSRNNKPTVKYLVLAGADFQKKGLAGFKNKKLALLKNNTLGRLFLNTRLLQEKLPQTNRFFSAVQEKNKESQAILDVFFGQADLCMVTDTAFSTMKELNPQVGRKLHVIDESPELLGVIFLFRPNYPPEHKKIALRALSNNFNQYTRGKQIMLLFNVEKMDAITDRDLDSVRKLLSDYERLKKTK